MPFPEFCYNKSVWKLQRNAYIFMNGWQIKGGHKILPAQHNKIGMAEWKDDLKTKIFEKCLDKNVFYEYRQNSTKNLPWLSENTNKQKCWKTTYAQMILGMGDTNYCKHSTTTLPWLWENKSVWKHPAYKWYYESGGHIILPA